MKRFKLGFGPMSREIAKILAEYSKINNFPMMIIASRNQADYNSGYVGTSMQLSLMVQPFRNSNFLLCRDHCGPYFSDLDKGLTVEQAIERCKQTIARDIQAEFDLIHIDVSRIPERQFDYAKELIDYTLSIKPDMMLEFGGEDNNGLDIEASERNLESQLEFLQQYKKNIVFVVTQTGSLTKDGQVGGFDILRNEKIKEKIEAAGFLFKEHNADYFTKQDIDNRINAGIDSLNIAPQLGRIQTDLLKELAPVDLWEKFSDHVYAQNYWQRWVSPGVTDKDIAVSVSGHYCFNSDQCKDIIANIDYDKFKNELTTRITALVEFYNAFTNENSEAKFQKVLRKRLEELRKRDPFIYR